MKKIISGTAYNTDTATRIAIGTWQGDDGEEMSGTLYQTRGGAFFVEQTESRWCRNEKSQLVESADIDELVPLSREDTRKWMNGPRDLFVYSDPFEKPRAEPEATIYVRVPASLKARVDTAARAANLSSNAWVMRCLEQSLAAAKQEQGATAKKLSKRKKASASKRKSRR